MKIFVDGQEVQDLTITDLAYADDVTVVTETAAAMHDVISVIDRHENNAFVQEALQKARIRQVPQWIELDDDKPRGTIKELPTREIIDTQVNEQLIVEFYSK